MQIFYRKKAVTSDTCQALPNGQSLIKVKTRHKKPSVPHGWNGCIHRVMNLYSHRGKNIPPALKRQHWELTGCWFRAGNQFPIMPTEALVLAKRSQMQRYVSGIKTRHRRSICCFMCAVRNWFSFYAEFRINFCGIPNTVAILMHDDLLCIANCQWRLLTTS